ncbi:DUF2948 family protein [Hyphobacterium sp. HN65]|uniref:DUF2948 family protein n=1 Tax=Hyphobacterium lacteum TaxID=3116575 RepID=A0ABU7LTJ9_9PROT|nr:DUF2948 family protein [Hyphobacterium sp. HN65]MEE2527218.1 DUF2948 family protein [Hyphobacterium sp. HN65]
MARRKPLRLAAEDAGDLEVLSAALQDAVAQLGDFSFDRRRRRFTAVFNRFRWEDRGFGEAWRTRSAFDVSGVLGVKSKRLKRGAPSAIVSLLSISFEPGEAPGGVLVLAFSGGGEMKLELECIDALLADISEPWPVKSRPAHEDGK